MSDAKIPLTFGVELEMAVACLFEGDDDQDPSDTRNVRLYPNQEDIDDFNKNPTSEGDLEGTTKIRCKKHIRNILAQAGLPVGMVEYKRRREESFARQREKKARRARNSQVEEEGKQKTDDDVIVID